jgi:hypothetical protein
MPVIPFKSNSAVTWPCAVLMFCICIKDYYPEGKPGPGVPGGSIAGKTGPGSGVRGKSIPGYRYQDPFRCGDHGIEILKHVSLSPSHLVTRSPSQFFPVSLSPSHLVPRSPSQPFSPSPGHLVPRSPSQFFPVSQSAFPGRAEGAPVLGLASQRPTGREALLRSPGPEATLKFPKSNAIVTFLVRF